MSIFPKTEILNYILQLFRISNAVIDISDHLPPQFVYFSTSLNSLGAEIPSSKHTDDDTHTVDGNTIGVISSVGGSIAKTIGKLEKTIARDSLQQGNSSDFIRCNLRASHNGTLGYLHKSISSPSVTQ